MRLLDDAARVESLTVLSGFREEFYGCLAARADALSELADALLCADEPVKALVDQSLEAEHRRGHGALYDGLNSGRLEMATVPAGGRVAAVAQGGRETETWLVLMWSSGGRSTRR